MQVRIYHGFGELPASYDALFEQAARQSFFLSRSWFENFLSTMLEPGARPTLYGVEERPGGRPLALLPTRCPAGPPNSHLFLRKLGPRTMAGLTNYQTPEFAPLFDPLAMEHSTEVFDAIAHAIRDTTPSFGFIDFCGLDRTSFWYEALIHALRSTGLVVEPYFYFGSWFARTQDMTLETYLSVRSKSVQKQFKNYERKARRLAKHHQVRFQMVSSSEGLDVAIGSYERIERASWKDPEPFPEYAAGLIRTAAVVGALRMGLLYVDEVPSAVELAVLSGTRVSLLKTHYDEHYRDHSVGALVMVETLRHLLNVDGATEVSLGLDDAGYKTLWASDRRELWGIRAYDPRSLVGARELARDRVSQLLQLVKDRLKPKLRPLHEGALAVAKRLPGRSRRGHAGSTS